MPRRSSAEKSVVPMTLLALGAAVGRDNENEFWVQAVNELLIVAATDTDGTIVFANQKFCQISGYTEEELIGKNHRILKSGVHNKVFFKNMYRKIANGRQWRGLICNRAKMGDLYWVDTTIIPYCDGVGRPRYYVALRYDITELVQARDSLKLAAETDLLTGAFNLAASRNVAQALIARILETAGHGYVAIIDLDRFKSINDVYGYPLGDQVLQIIVSRLRRILDAGDVVGRIGGDELLLVWQDEDDVPHRALNKVKAVISEEIVLGSARIVVDASIGLASFPDDSVHIGELLRKADIAARAAKLDGGGRVLAYSPALEHNESSKRKAEREACQDIADNRFEVYFQPIGDTQGLRIVGMEALLRRREPDGRIVNAGDFKELFSFRRFALEVDDFVRRRVIEQISLWRRDNVPFGWVSINLTTLDFEIGSYAERLLEALRTADVPPTCIKVEVTEDMLLSEHLPRIRSELSLLAQAGVKMCFDDFGTGFASLTHLKQLPLSVIKIDRGFIANVEGNRHDKEIVSCVIRLAHGLGLTVVAEGVENEAQRTVLSAMKCDFIQGYLLGHALPAEDVAGMIAAQHLERFSNAIESGVRARANTAIAG